MKNLLRLLILTISILMVSIPVFANSNVAMPNNYYFNSLYNTEFPNSNNSIQVQLNGEMIDFTDANGDKVEPQIVNNRTMVPMRKIFEVFGANVEWIGETRSIKATTEELEIGLQIDNPIAILTNKNGEKTEIKLDSVPVIIDGRTLVPVRFIAESLDKKVGWDSYNRAVIIISPEKVENLLKENASNLYEYLNEDVKMIESYEAKIELDGNIEQLYHDEMTSVDIDGNMELKLSEKALEMDIEINLSGFEKAIEEIGTDKIKIEVILDIENEEVYVKSDLIENSKGKWVKYELDEDEKEEFRTLIESAKMQTGYGIDKLIDELIPEENLNLYYYKELEDAIKIITKMMGNDKLKVSGNKNKTYTFNMNLDDLCEIIGIELTENEKEEMKFEFGFKFQAQDGIAQKSTINFLLSQKNRMSMEFELDGEFENHNEKINIKMPNEENIITEKELSHKASVESLKEQIELVNSILGTYAGEKVSGSEVKEILYEINYINENDIFPNDIYIIYRGNAYNIDANTHFEEILDSNFYCVTLTYDENGYVAEMIIDINDEINQISAAQIALLNSELEMFGGNKIRGSEVKTLIRKIEAFNANDLFPQDINIIDYRNGYNLVQDTQAFFDEILDSKYYSVSLGYNGEGYIIDALIDYEITQEKASELALLNSELEMFGGEKVKGTEVKRLISKIDEYKINGVFPNDINIIFYMNGEYIFDDIDTCINDIKDSEFYSVVLSYDERRYVSEVIIRK